MSILNYKFYNFNFFTNLFPISILWVTSEKETSLNLDYGFFLFSPEYMLFFCNLFFFIILVGLLYSKDFIILLISFELIFLSIIFQFCIYSFMFGWKGISHNVGLVMSMFIIGIVAVESAIILACYILITRLITSRKEKKTINKILLKNYNVK